MSRSSAFLAAIFLATVGTIPIDANAAMLSLVGSSTKVCQFIGDNDWATGQATAAQTHSKFGLDGVDLGFPVDSGSGPLYFLFSDTLPVVHPTNSKPSEPPDDALGWTTQTPPDGETCLGLQLATSAPKTLARPTVAPPDPAGNVQRAVRRRVYRRQALCVLLDGPLRSSVAGLGASVSGRPDTESGRSSQSSSANSWLPPADIGQQQCGRERGRPGDTRGSADI
jgi:hypothetical protein